MGVINSVQFSLSVVSNSLQPHEPQYARLPCPSPTPGVHSSSCPLSWWWPSNHLILCHPLLFCPQIRVFQMSQLFASGGQSTGVSAPTSVLPMNTQDWSPLGMDWLDLAVQGTLKSSPTPQFKSINSSALSLLHSPILTSIHDYLKNHWLDGSLMAK